MQSNIRSKAPALDLMSELKNKMQLRQKAAGQSVDNKKQPENGSVAIIPDLSQKNNRDQKKEPAKNPQPEKQIKILEEKLAAAQKKLNEQHKVLLYFQSSAVERTKREAELQAELNEALTVMGENYLFNIATDSSISAKEIALLINYIAEDFQLAFLHKSALAELGSADKLRNSINQLYNDYHLVNQNILLGRSFDDGKALPDDAKKTLDAATKEICTAHIQQALKSSQQETAHFEKNRAFVAFLIEILKRIDYLQPNSPLSLFAKRCNKHFIQRNSKKLIDDAKNIYEFAKKMNHLDEKATPVIPAQTATESVSFFSSALNPQPYFSSVTNLLYSAYSRALETFSNKPK